jgi:hypothetical protein
VHDVEKEHIGNVKLSESKKAIKIHIFSPEQFFVIPISEITKELNHPKPKIAKVFQYVNGEADVVGELYPPVNEKKYYSLTVESETYKIRTNYIQLLLNNSNLTLNVYKE